MTVPTFPTPVEGELYSSVVARYLRRTAGYAKRNLGLIGLDQANAGSVVPITVVKLAQSMPEGHPWANNPKEIVTKHTLIPLFLQSSSKEFFDTTIHAISQGLNGNPAATLGLTKPRQNSKTQWRHNSKFCPDRVCRDIESLGFPVLYRQHQPEFVKYCARHSRPLCYSCLNCSSQIRTIRWKMAGQCDCESPQTPVVIDQGIDEISKSSLIWIAQQVEFLLEGDAPHTDTKYFLRGLLETHGLISATGRMRNVELENAIENEIGSRLSHEFGFVVDRPLRGRTRHDLSRIFHTHHNGTFIIYNLIVAKIFCDDIRQIGSICESRKFLKIIPKSISPHKVFLDNQLIQDALFKAKGSVTKAAVMAELKPDKFISAARHHKIALPLSERQCDRIGWDRLRDIREAIKSGMEFKKICGAFEISRWTMRLILADKPDLEYQGKARRNEIKIHHAKERISALIELHPQITRTEIRKQHTRTMDVVIMNHPTWINHNIPIQPTVRTNRTSDSQGRQERLQNLSFEIQSVKKREFQKQQRPTRLTITRLKKDCAMASSGSFPEPFRSELEQLFEQASESIDIFHDRLIKWAISEYAKLLIPISANRLRRIARLPVSVLLSCRELVMRYAQMHKLTYHSRCSLSPFVVPPDYTES